MPDILPELVLSCELTQARDRISCLRCVYVHFFSRGIGPRPRLDAAFSRQRAYLPNLLIAAECSPLLGLYIVCSYGSQKASISQGWLVTNIWHDKSIQDEQRSRPLLNLETRHPGLMQMHKLPDRRHSLLVDKEHHVPASRRQRVRVPAVGSGRG